MMNHQIKMVGADGRKILNQLFFDAWGSPLTQTQFLDRQKQLQALSWTKERESPWALFSDKGEVLSSCEITEVKSYLNGEVGRSFGIASVYTPPEFRKRGYAETLLSGTMDHFVQKFSDTHAFYLYSEVGPTLYGRLGFKECLARERVFSPFDSTATCEAISESLVPKYLNMLLPTGSFYILPEFGQIGWHITRECVYGTYLHRRFPDNRGASLGNSFVLWMADYKYESLRAMVFQSERAAEAEQLIFAGRTMAKKLGLKDFRIWEGDGFRKWDELGEPGTSMFMEDSLPMVRPVSSRIQVTEMQYLPRAMWV